MRVLVVNAGSSSIKLRIIGPDDDVLLADDVERRPRQTGELVEGFLAAAGDVDAVGHRVVHGGATFEHPLVIDAAADGALAALAELAPLHNPPALQAIHDLRRRRPRLRQVACFDTTFHLTMPAHAATYALPARWRREWGIRRFGFHGLSHAWASRRTAQLLGTQPTRLPTLRVVTAHIGSGASLAAVRGGRSVDTTMGFTPMEGLVMSTRAGSVDPGALVWAVRHGLDADGLEDALEHESGLLGLSERSGDLRDVLAGADDGDARCALAYAVYVHRLQTSIGAMAVSAGGVDALTFTGGAGEASSRLRSDVCAGLGALGISPLQADTGTGDRILSDAGPHMGSAAAGPAVLVVAAREDLEIAHGVRRALRGDDMSGA